MACQSLLEAVTEDAGTMSIVELDENDVEVAAPSPVLPQPQSRTLPQPQPRMLPPPQSRVLPPPPPIPPMALQKAPPKPLTKAPPVPVGLRPFVITAEKGSPHEPAAVLTRHSGPVRAFVLGPLRASVAAALRGQGIDADIHAGEAGFGADAYVSVYVRADKQRLRVPVAIVDAFGTATHYGNAIQENLTGNARALAECVGAYRRPDPRWACDYRAVESAVRRLMLLISAEALAGNAGVLVAGEGALTVRRTAQMAVAVGALSPQPAAAIARLVASIAANSPQKNIVFDPPVFLRVEEMILATNPVLESFGNAKTTRNDNSSRFGKFLEIRFSERHAIEAAYIRTYLLERSRVVDQPRTERNFHVFYQLLAAAPDALRAELGGLSRDPDAYAYTAQTAAIPGVDDAVEYATTCAALGVIGVDEDQQRRIMRVLAALLHVGNIEIAGASERVGASIAADDGGAADAACQRAVELLAVDGALFRKWLTKRQIVTRSEKIVSNMTRAQAVVVRDSVAKLVYAHLFEWIVRTINESLQGDNSSTGASFIGVLDIYGFEHFERNSFEQFCINYANEKLQQNFNRHVFKLEQEEYQREQLANWTFVDFQDNQPCIDLIEGRPMGVLALLDEESRLQQGSDQAFAEKLIKQFGNGGGGLPAAAFFAAPRFGADRFTIRHYAHSVEYAADGFIDKNKDAVPDEIQNVLRASGDPLVQAILNQSTSGGSAEPAPATEPRLSVRAARKPTLGAVFRHSLVALMETIEATESHYIRCVKPNDAKSAWGFDAPMVLAQLRACGVLETIRISCAGYPSRLPLAEFIHRYAVLLAPLPASRPLGADACRALAARILGSAFAREPGRFQVGLTKVFFRAGALALLEKLRVERLHQAATCVQRLVRAHQQRTRFLRLRAATARIQRSTRGAMARRRYAELRRQHAAVLLQRLARGALARALYRERQCAVLRLQALARGVLARRAHRELRRERAARVIQRLARGLLARRHARRALHLVTRMQARVRGAAAKRELRRRREEARSAAHFKDVTYKLEGKLILLTRQLDESQARAAALEVRLRRAVDDAQALREKDAVAEARALALGERVSELESAKAEADARVEELTELVALARREAEDARGDAQAQLARDADARSLLEAKLAELEAELAASRAQLADVRSSQIAGSAPAPSSAAAPSGASTQQIQPPPPDLVALPSASSIKRSDTAASARWRAPASATGYELADQHIQQLPPPPDASTSASRSLARMLGALSPLPSSASSQPNANDPAHDAHQEEDAEVPVFELRSEDEVRDMLEHEENLITEVLNELIGDLHVPMPNLDAEYQPPDLLFPAHLIGLCVIKMFQYNLARRIDRLLMSAIARVQKKTAAFESDYTSAFWLSNVFELLSIIKTSMTEHQSSTHEYADSERAMNDGMQYLETLLSDIYFGWIKDLQKRFVKLIIPGVVESEALPGFTASDSGFFNRLMGTGPRESTVKIENVLSFFNHIWRTMEFYYVDSAIMRQIMSELLCNIGVTAFNNIIMRRNFCSWKRGMQIQYNLTRIEEWCKTHSVADATRNLDRLLQLVKLLQLQKSTEQDIDIMFEVCDLLNPAQIKKLLSIYAVSDYENPIIGPVMTEVTRRASPSEKIDKILLDTNDLNDQVLYLTARKVPAIETYIPPEFRMPRIRALVDSQTDMAYDEEEEDEDGLDDTQVPVDDRQLAAAYEFATYGQAPLQH
ncbi:Myosin type-2 heavy chain 1 [Coemansia sp. RSA 2322]|nr:Myosin type-2 heavy chain 1 [Coemansia sp. RSA 2322]